MKSVFRLAAPRLGLLCLVSACLHVSVASAKNGPVYKDAKAPLDARVNDLFRQLTQEEKLSLLTGTGFATAAIPRLGVPAMEMADAGQGVRGGNDGTHGPATAFPAGVTMASTWDPELIGRVGKAIGEETRNKGTGAQILLGPAVNIQRSPLGGRNGEYFSEDPYLAGRLAVSYIKGMQATGVAACVKHFACNNEEADRDSVDVVIGERALREIYLPAFEAAVREGGVWAVMSSYNQVNGYHASANHYLLTDVLKNGWGFDGVVMSDWGGVHETAGTLNAGNDLEMPGGEHLTPGKLSAALKSGELTQATVDSSVRRVLRTIVRVGLLDGPMPAPRHGREPEAVDSAEHRRVALEGAAEGIVLLKNEGNALPLGPVHSIAVIGRAATDPQYGADGSPKVVPVRGVTPLEGIRKRAKDGIRVTYAAGEIVGTPIPATGAGWHAEYFADRDMAGAPLLVRDDAQIQFNWNEAAPGPGVNRERFAARWTGTVTAPATGRFTLVFTGDDGYRVDVDGKRVIDKWADGGVMTTTGQIDMVAGQTYAVKAEYFQSGGGAEARLDWAVPAPQPFAEAVAAAKAADVALVFVSTKGNEGEGQDRNTMSLSATQEELIRAVAAANKRTIVVMNNGTPIAMNGWVDQVPGLIETWFPGEEGGTALASILFGDRSPSGKLPTTLARRREDYPDSGNFPGTLGHVKYAEGIYVGYRHFDRENIEPLFPFGHGLSYTTFSYAKVRLVAPQGNSPVLAEDITNTGKVEATEVVQLYAHDASGKVDRPARELRGFARVTLKPGETKTVSFPIAPKMFAYFDVASKAWRADKGPYELQVGASSRDIRVKLPITLITDYLDPVPLSAEQVDAFPAAGDVAANKPTTASSVEKPDCAPENATDGNNSTRWSSKFEDNQWLAVDLGSPTKIDHARLKWEAAYASQYKIQSSDDGQTWTTLATQTDGHGDTESLTFPTTTARHVRVLCIKRGTRNGNSLYSFEVFAAKQ